VKITGSSAPDWDRLIDSPSTSSLGTRSKQRSTGGAKRAVKTRAQMEIEMRIKMEMKLDSKVGLWVRRRSERLTMPDVYRAFGQVEKSAGRQGAERKGSLWSLWPKPSAGRARTKTLERVSRTPSATPRSELLFIVFCCCKARLPCCDNNARHWTSRRAIN